MAITNFMLIIFYFRIFKLVPNYDIHCTCCTLYYIAVFPCFYTKLQISLFTQRRSVKMVLKKFNQGLMRQHMTYFIFNFHNIKHCHTCTYTCICTTNKLFPAQLMKSIYICMSLTFCLILFSENITLNTFLTKNMTDLENL